MTFEILSEAETKVLLAIARNSIERAFHTLTETVETTSEGLNQKTGAFVTLYQGPRLRGCIGNLSSTLPLWQNVQALSLKAAFEDPRFKPVTQGELGRMTIHISILSTLKACKENEIRVGKHGLCVSHGFSRGVLLPSVPIQYGWNIERFMNETCMKAGLNPSQKGNYRWESFTAMNVSEPMAQASPR